MQELIPKYLDDHKHAWSKTTMRSEASRMKRLGPLLSPHLDDPQTLYNLLVGEYKPYALLTLFTRLSHFYQWMIDEGHKDGPNAFARWKKRNAQLFKNAYQREKLEVTYDEAKELITGIPDQEARYAALNMLHTGVRIHELEKISGGEVIGKGGKRRKIYHKILPSKASRDKIYAELKKVGLKPHTLRKLFATRLARAGARPEDLCQVLGWTSIKTAYYYLQPKKDDELRSLVESL